MSLLSYVILFSPDSRSPLILSPDPLTAAAQWSGASLLAVLLAGGHRPVALLLLVSLLCGLHAALRSVSFTARTHARANMAAGRTPVAQLFERLEKRQTGTDGNSARRRSQVVEQVEGEPGFDENEPGQAAGNGSSGVSAAGMRHKRTASLKEQYKQWKQNWQQKREGQSG